MKHQPKGGMCSSCRYKYQYCTQLDFKLMRPVKQYKDGTVAVICKQYVKEQK